jgi:hypothetical protein
VTKHKLMKKLKTAYQKLGGGESAVLRFMGDKPNNMVRVTNPLGRPCPLLKHIRERGREELDFLADAHKAWYKDCYVGQCS